MRLFIAFIILLLTASCGEAEEVPSSGELLVIGDSLSAAYGMAPEQGWVHLLQSRIRDNGYGYEVYNISASGATSSEALGRLRKALPARMPQVTVIAIGGNDGLRGQPVRALRANLKKMIDLLADSGSRVVLVPMRVPDNYGRAYSEGFNKVYHDIIGEYDLPATVFLLDRVHDRAGMMQFDRIHPTASAQETILDNIWPAIESVL